MIDILQYDRLLNYRIGFFYVPYCRKLAGAIRIRMISDIWADISA
jgi:hypothetical protein